MFPCERHRSRRVERERRRRRLARNDVAPPRQLLGEALPMGDPFEEARRRARAKAKLAQDILRFAVVVGLLAVFVRPLAWIVGICWGIGLASDFAKKVVEPVLRRRWIDREVRRELRNAVPVERQEVEDEHARRIEEIAAGVAHEIRNPITAAKSLVQQMGEDPAAADNVEYAHVALEELNRVERSISHLLRYAREEEVHLDSMNISEVIASALESFRDRVARSGTRVETAVEGGGTMRGDSEKLRRVIINLLGNALDALEDGRTRDPRIAVRAGENLAGTEVWVRVADNGPGISPDRLERIFSPFYTSKESGTGLGLAISKKVVDAHGGVIEASSRPGAGTEFLVTLPKQGAAAGAAK